ncbi:MAG: QueG-associated DUF1730 domain-containing protein [Candidatus Izemoplasma sp.]|nr:QueG-associated DUF1730 domain-containing protein [Candidatus Izemoplasma sp.]
MTNPITDSILNYVDFVGYVSVKEYIEKRQALNKRDQFDDYAALKPYQTIAVVGLAYPKQEVQFKGKGYGLLSRYSYGTDYHSVFREKLKQIDTLLDSSGVRSYSSVDISPIDERFAAALTHQGFRGKNQAFIHKDFGPYVYLATILIDVDIDDPYHVVDNCGSCTACIDACPTGALDEGFNQSLCLSHISQEKRSLTRAEIPHFKTMVYGCDICYKVCPKSKGIDIHRHPEFEPTGIENVNLIELLSVSNKTYLKDYGNNASSWRGATVIRRNALALLYNQNVKKAIPFIKESMTKYHSAWYQETAKTILQLFKEKKQ